MQKSSESPVGLVSDLLCDHRALLDTKLMNDASMIDDSGGLYYP